MKFEVKGFFMKKEKKNNFSRVVDAPNKEKAIEKVYSLFGSEHKVARRHITVNEVTEYKEEVKK